MKIIKYADLHPCYLTKFEYDISEEPLRCMRKLKEIINRIGMNKKKKKKFIIYASLEHQSMRMQQAHVFQ